MIARSLFRTDTRLLPPLLALVTLLALIVPYPLRLLPGIVGFLAPGASTLAAIRQDTRREGALELLGLGALASSSLYIIGLLLLDSSGILITRTSVVVFAASLTLLTSMTYTLRLRLLMRASAHTDSTHD
jgi:hypothetical protein